MDKSPFKANYCRLPVKSRAEKLFDQIVSKPTTTFADLSNNIDLKCGKKATNYSKKKKGKGSNPKPVSKKVDQSKNIASGDTSDFKSWIEDSSLSSEDSPDLKVKTKPKRKVNFATYGGRKDSIGEDKEPIKKKTCIRRKEVPKCTKEAVLDAFLKAGLPDYEAIAALPLNVVVMDDENKKEEKKSPPKTENISRKQICKPFIPLLKKIDSFCKGSDASRDNNPVINVESPTERPDSPDLADSEAETVLDECEENRTVVKGVSTPLPGGKLNPPPRFDLSCIPATTFRGTDSEEDTTLTPKAPPLTKKKWNVADRRGTQLLPPHPVVFDEPHVISNDSIEVSNDQPLDWSNVRSVAEMDESVHSVFNADASQKFGKEIRHSLDLYKSNQAADVSKNRLKYYRRSIVETANALHALGKSCRTIIRESPRYRRSTRARKSTVLDPAVSFLIAFDKTFMQEEDKHLPITSKDKVLSLCKPPKITTFDNVLDETLINSMFKIGEGSYGEVFKSKTEEDQEVVVKLVPLVGSTTIEDDTWTQILPELVISLTFGDLRLGTRNKTPNFINTLKASCASGTWPKKLIDAWEEYHQMKASENNHPNKYGPKSNWLVILLNNGGIEVENYEFHSAVEALSVILQTTISLAAAEEEFEFEHRDLHTGNVLVMPCTESYLEYKVANKEIKLPSMNLKVSVIDFTLARMSKDGYIVYDDLSKYEDIFTGEGDYQFEIYRLMRKANGNDWKSFTPYTNILWIHYLSMKMVTDKKFKARSKSHQGALKSLKSLKENLLNYNSTKEFVQSSYFTTIMSNLPNC